MPGVRFGTWTLHGWKHVRIGHDLTLVTLKFFALPSFVGLRLRMVLSGSCCRGVQDRTFSSKRLAVCSPAAFQNCNNDEIDKVTSHGNLYHENDIYVCFSFTRFVHLYFADIYRRFGRHARCMRRKKETLRVFAKGSNSHAKNDSRGLATPPICTVLC